MGKTTRLVKVNLPSRARLGLLTAERFWAWRASVEQHSSFGPLMKINEFRLGTFDFIFQIRKCLGETSRFVTECVTVALDQMLTGDDKGAPCLPFPDEKAKWTWKVSKIEWETRFTWSFDSPEPQRCVWSNDEQMIWLAETANLPEPHLRVSARLGFWGKPTSYPSENGRFIAVGDRRISEEEGRPSLGSPRC